MDALHQIGRTRFVWDADKAESNLEKHGVTFQTAAEVILDPLVKIWDATPGDEVRLAAVGIPRSCSEILHVIHVEILYDLVRIISARQATKGEIQRYEEYE